MTATLAIKGGDAVRRNPFPRYRTIGAEEKEAVSRVLDSGVLSGFLGSWGKKFYGGPEVRALEEQWASYFGVKHAISVNSATSGLYAAVGAIGVAPGDEVIVSPFTMSASATAALVFNGVPVFADIEEQYFCLDPASVEERITERTKAIIVVDIFGQPYDADAINEIARRHNLLVIEDASQAPGARYKERFAGTLGDIGVFSLNCHKHIQSGEGGVVVTNDDRLADRVRLIRNHAEAVVGSKGETDLVNMVGYNFRMTEIEAAISQCQLRKLSTFVEKRLQHCRYLHEALKEIPALSVPPVRNGASHVYYLQPFFFNEALAGVKREDFVNAVTAELQLTEENDAGGTVWSGYCRPLYLEPLYQKRIAYGKDGFPFTGSTVEYRKGICPVAERMYEKELIMSELMHPGLDRSDLDDVIHAFKKVWEYREALTVPLYASPLS